MSVSFFISLDVFSVANLLWICYIIMWNNHIADVRLGCWVMKRVSRKNSGTLWNFIVWINTHTVVSVKQNCVLDIIYVVKKEKKQYTSKERINLIFARNWQKSPWLLQLQGLCRFQKRCWLYNRTKLGWSFRKRDNITFHGERQTKWRTSHDCHGHMITWLVMWPVSSEFHFYLPYYY